MSHVDDGQLNALLDGELSPEEMALVRAHVDSCGSCARRLEDARRFLAEASALIDVVQPAPRAEEPAPSQPAEVRRVAKTAKEVALKVSRTEQEPAIVLSEETPRKVSSTAKEVAIPDIDGSTQKSPAIRPIFPREAQRAAAAPEKQRPRIDWIQLSWAAVAVLALGTGYMLSEIRQAGQASAALEEGAPTVAVVAPPAEASPEAPGARSTTGSGTRQSGPVRRTASREPPKLPPAVTVRQPARDEPALGAAGAGVSQRPGDLAGAGGPPPAAARAIDATGLAPAAAAPLAQQPAARAAAPAEPGRTAPTARAMAARELADSVARPAFRRASMDEAVRRLSGAIRLLDGMQPSLVEIGPGTLVSGADPSRDVVRITYRDSQRRRLVLDQQRASVEPGAADETADAARGRVNMALGDTLVTTTPNGTSRIRWLDRKNFWLSVSGTVPPDSLRILLDRIR